MKRILYFIFILLLIFIFGKSCIKADIPESNTFSSANAEAEQEIDYPKSPRNITINNIDYLQSQAPCGNYGGELISSIIGEGPKTFNPFTATDATSSEMGSIMYDGLFTTNAVTGNIVPKLAKSYEIKGNDYIITLRHGIKWSDGVPITAEDVLFTWNDIVFAGLGNTSVRDMLIINGKLPTLTKLDDYTVKFTLPTQFAPFLRQLTLPIAPKHYFTQKPDWDKNFDTFLSTTTKPEEIVSSGAFRLKEYVAAQRVVFKKNPNYYEINLKRQRLPYLEKLVFLIVGDFNNEILKFEGGELDVIGLKGGTVALYKGKEAKSDYKIYNLGPDTGTMFAAINMNTRKNKDGKFYVDPVKQRWFNDRNFRAAIDYATDRNNMVINVAQGIGIPLFTAESLNSIYLNKNLKGHSKDINLAESYLKKSGFYKDSNGILHDKYGNTVEFNLYTNTGNTEREAVCVMLKQDLEELGMKVNFKPLEFNSLVNKLTNSYDWDLMVMGLTGSPLEPHSGKNVWYSTGSLHLFNQRPAGKPATDKLNFEKELDDIFDIASLKVNFAERKKYYDRYQEIIYNEKPLIYLYSPIRISAIRRKFGNLFPSSLMGLTYNIEEIFVKNTEETK